MTTRVNNQTNHGSVLFAATACLLAAHAAQANIVGFGDFSQFSINQADGASAPNPNPATNSIRLVTGTSQQSRSIFFQQRQAVSAFSASFNYWITGTPTSPMGATFTIQNSTQGANTVAVPEVSGVTTQFGYRDFFGTFGRSVAVSLESGSLGSGSSSSAVYTNASVSGGSIATGPVNLFSGNRILVHIDYNGTFLRTRMTDTVTGQVSADQFFAVNLESTLQSSTGFIGFTASSNNNVGVDQYFSDLQFTQVPSPMSAALLALGGVTCLRRRR